ncbi:hypothetical protein [Novosphingobium album (ex Liu et al. 2023)]|uniref:Polysaccharide pyruvyl transferase domain-containing protein n=1 Tax=Novosphingobium album (ex Liu et al. 2023) TaxID=3031130 RepID=A0ABT5WKA2_9SPHN|nr:hypothetical protein [Novosphingobium album (ex Liu et al. 2023)]MDE8650465.1 hypothetical protein [Novosphingobium album (ex Liu et al. 2023)]
MTTFTLGYHKSAIGNVGDDLNPWLIERMLPDLRFGESGSVLLCIGSILVSEKWDGFDRKLVLGTGARSKARVPALDESWDIRFVRGPRSVEALGAGEAISDPALLLARYVRPSPNRKGIGIVPYFRTNHALWRVIAAQLGARLISPRMPVEPFLEALNSCERVFCEAMHGSIFADALRIPWRPVTFRNVRNEGETHHFKWSDWVGSVELDFDPVVQPIDRMKDWPQAGLWGKASTGWNWLQCSRELAGRLKRELREDAFQRSADSVFEDRIERMAAVFRQVNEEFR